MKLYTYIYRVRDTHILYMCLFNEICNNTNNHWLTDTDFKSWFLYLYVFVIFLLEYS